MTKTNNYRILKTTDEDGVWYFPQKRILWVFWRKIFSWGPYPDGGFNSLEKAQEKLCNHLKKPVREYIDFDYERDCK